ncbi:arginine--tRNA ligase [Candidatus Saccharibacteria bacterium]|nr:arginine--tRNA ligase [Candidatus Saccharibacteria bacterium]
MHELKKSIAVAVKNVFNVDIEPELTWPDEKFGDYSTNVALQLGKQLNKNPREVAIAVAAKMHAQPKLQEVNIAGPGFINFRLSDRAMWNALNVSNTLAKPLTGKEILVEFGDPNPFKEMHIGHLYSYIVGDCISRLLEASGANIKRLSYHGDVGLHVAKAIWAMLQTEAGEDLDTQQDIGMFYRRGDEAYRNDEKASEQIKTINEHIYNQDDQRINELYRSGREKSFEYFDVVLNNMGIKTNKRYFESESAETGSQFVRAHIGKVFKESEGAVIYKGERVGLHTRVFITSKGLPTYEAKDLGLAELKNRHYPNAAQSIIITANEQSEYFKVMLAALSEFDDELAAKTRHLSHGFITLSSGKMSSRSGDVYSAVDLLADVEREAKKLYPKSPSATHLAAIKYGFLKHRLGSDIVYDAVESVSLEGNSGPYIQYAHARAMSILSKKGKDKAITEDNDFNSADRSLARKIIQYPETVERACDELLPSHITTYLYELAQTFNKFYEKSRVVGDPREAVRLTLVDYYVKVLKSGLDLLGIEAPEHL